MSTPQDVEALQARIRELEGRLGSGAGAERPRGSRAVGLARGTAVVVLLVLATVLAPITVVATWAHDEIGDTDRYVETVAPLATDPAVQRAIAERISEEIYRHIAVEDITAEALTALAGQAFVPPRAGTLLPSLAVPLSSAIERFIGDRITTVVTSDTFEEAWVEANRQAHAQLVAVLTGEGGDAVSVEDGAVRLDIASLVAAVKQRLLDEGFAFASRIPEVSATFTIFQAENIGRAQTWFSWLDTIARVLPVLTLLLIFAAVMVSRGRRRTLLAAGLCVAGSMILLGLALNLVRPLYLDAVPESALPPDAAAVIYDQLVRFIRTALRAVGLVALAVAAAAFWFAPTGAGAACRHGAAGVLSRARGRATRAGMNTGPVGRFLSTYRAFCRSLVVGIGAVVYLALDHPTGADALAIIIGVVVVLVVLEFVSSGEDAEPAERPEVTPGG